MEPVKPYPNQEPGRLLGGRLDADTIKEYGAESFGKKAAKYLGYALLLIFLLAFVCWPFFIGMK